MVAVDPSGKVIAKLGDFDGLTEDGVVRGLLFPVSPAFSKDGNFLYVTNLALDLRVAGARWPLIPHGLTPKLPLVLMEQRAEVASPITALSSLAISRPLHTVGITSATLPVDMPRLVSRKPLQLGQ